MDQKRRTTRNIARIIWYTCYNYLHCITNLVSSQEAAKQSHLKSNPITNAIYNPIYNSRYKDKKQKMRDDARDTALQNASEEDFRILTTPQAKEQAEEITRARIDFFEDKELCLYIGITAGLTQYMLDYETSRFMCNDPKYA